MDGLLSREAGIQLRLRLLTEDIRQGEIAVQLRMDPGRLSKIINGRLPAPEGFLSRFDEAVESAIAARSGRVAVGA